MGDRYNVGGVLMPRPFKIRRFGHIGLNVESLSRARKLYIDDLGFRQTDELLDALGNPERDPNKAAIFTSHGADHHSLLLLPKALLRARDGLVHGMTINQLSWEVGSLEEIVAAIEFLQRKGVAISKLGRDMPGSNWCVYFPDPDGHPIELFYGMEQIGWDRRSKPAPMYKRRFSDAPSLPQISEAREIAAAYDEGVDLASGFRPPLSEPQTYVVGGVLMPRPFRVTGHGPVGLFVQNPAVSLHFYRDLLGFKLTETVVYHGHECHFLRCGVEHHSLIVAPVALRDKLGFDAASSLLVLGIRLGTYGQLRAAINYLRERGWCSVHDYPCELHPGIDYAAHLTDDDGHVLQLSYYMERLGWDGRPRSPSSRPDVKGPWPEAVEERPDSYADQVFGGPVW